MKLTARLLASIEEEARGVIRAALKQAISEVGREQTARIVWEELGWLPKAKSTAKRVL